jgi:hypothetical protein
LRKVANRLISNISSAIPAFISTRFLPEPILFFPISAVIRFSYFRLAPLPKQAGILSQQN